MSTYGLLVDYKWCSGCHSCELACKNEKNFSVEQELYGIKLLEVGPVELGNEKFEWNYIPVLTSFCDLCAERIKESGGDPPCVFTCLGQCLKFGTVDELSQVLNEKGEKAYLFLP